jgi:hypothetical protein
MHMNESVLKAIIIIAILVMLITLYVTGIAFVLGNNATYTILLHKFSALLIIGLLGVHAWLRRCTIRKLFQECVAIIRKQHIHHEDNIDFLIHNTKNQSFQELCLLFNYDASSLLLTLSKHHVHVKQESDTLKTIAKYNDKDMYQILLLMMKLHVEKNNPTPLYNTSCLKP